MATSNRFDVAIVGGGPAGAATARDIAAAGYRVVVVERKDTIGTPVQCSGLVTARTLKEAGLDAAIAHSAVRGATWIATT